ncbi:MAG: hypothetical protein ACRBBN_12090 [Methyloligellaceae bacterium]
MKLVVGVIRGLIIAALIAALVNYYRVFLFNLPKFYLLVVGKFPHLTNDLHEQNMLRADITVQFVGYVYGAMMLYVFAKSQSSKYLRWCINNLLIIGGIFALFIFVLFLLNDPNITNHVFNKSL